MKKGAAQLDTYSRSSWRIVTDTDPLRWGREGRRPGYVRIARHLSVQRMNSLNNGLRRPYNDFLTLQGP